MKSIGATVMQLELELLQRACRSDYQRLDALLADDFLEIGATGRSFGKADVLSRLPQESDIAFVATGMQASHLAQDVVLVTYQASRTHLDKTVHSKRSSIWVKGARGWQMRYHQGTYRESHAA
jgi:hypothetical protein